MTDRTLIAVDPERLERLERMVQDVLARLPEQDERPWLTRADMADALGVSQATVSRMAARGDVETKGAGSGRRYRQRSASTNV